MENKGAVSVEKSRDLKKHVAAIHCSNNLTLMQRKIANVLLYNAYKDLPTKDVHIITIPDLCKILGFNSHNHEALKDALRALISTVIEWNVINDKTQKECWTASSVLASVQIQGTECQYAYSHHMKQMLHSPAVYGRINLIIQSRFKSSYGLALYENCARFRNLPLTKWFPLDEFRKLMGVNPGEYEIFRDLNRRVIDKAVDEVNSHSDIIVAPEFKKVNRKVVDVRFSIKQREKKIRLGISDIPKEDNAQLKDIQRSGEISSLVHRLTKEFGVTYYVADEIVSQYEASYIDQKIMELLCSDSFKEGKIKNSAAFLVSSIKKDYQLSKSSQIIQHEMIKENLAKEEAFNKLKMLEDEREKQYEEYVYADFINQLKVVGDEAIRALVDEFFVWMKQTNRVMSSIVKGWYDENGIESKPFVSFFREYLKAHQHALYQEPCSYDEFSMG